VANQQIAMRVIELPVIEEKDDLDAAVRFQAAEAIAMPLEEAVLDYQVVGSVEGHDGARRLRVVLVAARRSMIDGFLGAVRGAGLKPEGIDLDAFAVVRMLADEVPEAPGVPPSSRAFCHLGGVANLAVASGRTCLFARALSTQWEAEGAASGLASEMRLSIDSYTASASSVPVADLVLSGPGSHNEAFVAELETHLGMPTSVAPALGHLEAPALDAGEDPSRFTVAAGLALGAAA
jgi:type IV pilus assembly protein PilM